jgi:MinD-like ATPase involved in chromosome partitioning or flagellar assembly
MDIENKIFCLYKYENVKKIIRSLFIIYNVLTGKSVTAISDNNCKLIAVTSSYGGGGKTSISLGLAQEFVRFRGKKTLYVNYEDCDGTWNYMDFQIEKKDDSIGSYLYYLNKGRNLDVSAFLKEDEYGVFYFKPSLGRNQLKGLCADDLCLFCNRLIETNMFEYIIFDCHACLDDSTLWLLKNSFRIIYLAEKIRDSDTIDYTQRDTGAIEYIENKFCCGLGEKLIKVYNKNNSMETEFENVETVNIETDVNSFQTTKGIRKINIERGFGEGVKLIANKIENS